MSLNNLKCEGLVSPLGISAKNPRFSFETDKALSWYRVIVFQNGKEIYKSRKSNKNITYIEYKGAPLKEKTKYSWQIEAEFKDKSSAVSEIQFFETGIYKKSSFKGSFITFPGKRCNYDNHVPAPIFKKQFEITKKIESARLYISGLGFYDLYLNGKRLNMSELTPYMTQYSKKIYYDTYDITDSIKTKNAISVILGNGLLNPFAACEWELHKASWVSKPVLWAMLEINYTDGIKETIATDKSWVWKESPILFDELRCGEYYDNRLNVKSLYEYSDLSEYKPVIYAKNTTGEMTTSVAPRINLIRYLEPKLIKKCEDGSYFYDFGENTTGVPEITISGKSGQSITMYFGEEIDKNGNFSQEATAYFQKPDYHQKDIYILSGNGNETWFPKFTYHGFRYVKVLGLLDSQAENFLKIRVIHSDHEENGGFNSSNEIINALQAMTRRSTLTNFHYFPTDCPHREKNGWTGDAALSSEHTLLNLKTEYAYEEWLRTVRDAQREDGALPGIVPTGGWGFKWGNGPAWDCVITEIPYQVYRFRGNIKIIEDNSDAIFNYLKYMQSKRDENGLTAYGLGDWCPPKRRCDKSKAPIIVTDTLTCINICQKAEFIFSELSQTEKMNYAKELKESLKASFKEHLVTKTMLVKGNTQTSQAMALYYGIFNKSEEKKAFAHLMRYIRKEDNHIDTGILGARVLFHVLAKYGQCNLATDIISDTTYPSYGYMWKSGATTLWENFEGDVSQNHHFYGDISNFFISVIVGIKVNERGKNVKEIIIAPHIVKSLDFAEGFYKTPYGKVVSKWKKEADNENIAILTIEIPENIKSRVKIPYGYKSENPFNHYLHAGKHEIKIIRK